MEKILIGKVVNVFGIKGQIKVYNYGESAKTYENLSRIWINEDEYHIKSVMEAKGTLVLTLKDLESRDEAEMLKGKMVFMSEADLPKLEEGEYYIRDLIGFDIFDKREDKVIGVLKDIRTDTYQQLYVVTLNNGKECLIPGVPFFIKDINKENRKITVELIEGML